MGRFAWFVAMFALYSLGKHLTSRGSTFIEVIEDAAAFSAGAVAWLAYP